MHLGQFLHDVLGQAKATATSAGRNIATNFTHPLQFGENLVNAAVSPVHAPLFVQHQAPNAKPITYPTITPYKESMALPIGHAAPLQALYNQHVNTYNHANEAQARHFFPEWFAPAPLAVHQFGLQPQSPSTNLQGNYQPLQAQFVNFQPTNPVPQGNYLSQLLKSAYNPSAGEY